MSVATVHSVLTYVLLCLGTTGLWMGEMNSVVFPYPILVSILAVLAYFVTDRHRWFELPMFVSNGLAILILFIMTFEFAHDSSASVLALAHFLVYLQCAKFFRVKSIGDYWQLYGLNLLQMSIACVVNREVGFGMLLLIYAWVGTTTLGSFMIRSAHETLSEPSRHSFPFRRLLRSMARLALFAFPCALILFWITPRVGPPRQTSFDTLPGGEQQLTTGFSKSVRLNEFQTVLENDDVVFDVWARTHNDLPAKLPADILWRGQVFVNYRDGEWSSSRAPGARSWSEERPLLPGQIRLTIKQHVLTGDVLFSPKPLFWASTLSPQDQLRFINTEGRLQHVRIGRIDREPRTEKLRYQLIVGMGEEFFRDADEISPSPTYLSQALYVPPNLRNVTETAQRLVEGVPASDIQTKITRLTNFIQRDGGFSYTLDLDAKDTTIDRVEDFLINTKRGHCEYFASALALMLRAVGVPTRVLNGFKGADYNQAGRYYQVRQLLAHSWVEAYIASEDRWQTIDPTPVEARLAEVQAHRSWWQSVFEVLDAAKNSWLNNVVGFSNEQQNLLVLHFLTEAGATLREALGGQFDRLLVHLQALRRLDFWFSPGGVILLIFLGSVIALTRGLIRRLRHRTKSRYVIPNDWPVYEKLLKVLAAQGWKKPRHQTPMEFADGLAKHLRDDPRLAPFAELPKKCSSVFYSVRFGDQTPDSDQTRRLQAELDAFCRALRS